MKRDAWYAAIAALGLCALTATYGLVTARDIADPKPAAGRQPLTASLPAPRPSTADTRTEAAAITILRERSPFVARESDGEGGARGLNLPQLAPPVRFSAPGEAATVTAAPRAPAPASVPASLPASVPERTAGASVPAAPVSPAPVQHNQGSLTLRGVFPSPNGGRALVALPDGQVVSVSVGGIVGGWRVLGIQQGAIRIGRGQRKILLSMPR